MLSTAQSHEVKTEVKVQVCELQSQQLCLLNFIFFCHVFAAQPYLGKISLVYKLFKYLQQISAIVASEFRIIQD